MITRVQTSKIPNIETSLKIDENNFEQVFKTYFGPLVNCVHGYLKDWEASREIVQGAFLKIWESRDAVEINTSIKNYLYSTVRNRMIDHFGSNAHEHRLKKSLKEEDATCNMDELDAYIIRERIIKSMNQMRPKMQNIFRLSKMEGLTHDEIAFYLGMSRRTVEDNMARALSLLKDELKNNTSIFDE